MSLSDPSLREGYEEDSCGSEKFASEAIAVVAAATAAAAVAVAVAVAVMETGAMVLLPDSSRFFEPKAEEDGDVDGGDGGGVVEPSLGDSEANEGVWACVCMVPGACNLLAREPSCRLPARVSANSPLV